MWCWCLFIIISFYKLHINYCKYFNYFQLKIISNNILIKLSNIISFIYFQAVEILYGIFVATEVAYYTYTYSVVDIKYYQKVTSYTRAAHLIGRFFSGFFAQVFISTKLVDTYQLNFLTLGSQYNYIIKLKNKLSYCHVYICFFINLGLAAATIWTVTLPPVKEHKPKSEKPVIKLVPIVTESKLEEDDGESVETFNEVSTLNRKKRSYERETTFVVL